MDISKNCAEKVAKLRSEAQSSPRSDRSTAVGFDEMEK
jgi:hypothetical protein